MTFILVANVSGDILFFFLWDWSLKNEYLFLLVLYVFVFKSFLCNIAMLFIKSD